MSNQTIETIKQRVRAAHSASPIAVFESDKSGRLNAVFANTVISQRDINRGHDDNGKKLIGVWDRHDHIHQMTQKLRKHIMEE